MDAHIPNWRACYSFMQSGRDSLEQRRKLRCVARNHSARQLKLSLVAQILEALLDG